MLARSAPPVAPPSAARRAIRSSSPRSLGDCSGAAGGLADDPCQPLLVPNGAADQIQLANARAVAFGCGTAGRSL
jgi:hypothetical protein